MEAMKKIKELYKFAYQECMDGVKASEKGLFG